MRLLGTVWIFSFPSLITFVSALLLWGAVSCCDDHPLMRGIIGFLWWFGTLLLWLSSIANISIAAVCFVVLLVSRDAPPRAKWSGLLATASALLCLALVWEIQSSGKIGWHWF